MCRTNEREPSRIAVIIATGHSSASKHSTVALTNVSLGHSTVFRIVALVLSLTHTDDDDDDLVIAEEDAPPPPINSSSNSFSLELRECRLVCCHQHPSPASKVNVPVQLQDFFSLHKEMFSVELPHFYLHLPLVIPVETSLPSSSPSPFSSSSSLLHPPLPSVSAPLPPFDQDEEISLNQASINQGDAEEEEEEEDDDDPSPQTQVTPVVLTIIDAALVMATTGYPGYPSLPVLQLPHLHLTRKMQQSGENDEVGTTTQLLSLSISEVDIGVHPSHLVISTLAMHLLQQEMIVILGGRGRNFTSSVSGTFLFINLLNSIFFY